MWGGRQVTLYTCFIGVGGVAGYTMELGRAVSDSAAFRVGTRSFVSLSRSFMAQQPMETIQIIGPTRTMRRGYHLVCIVFTFLFAGKLSGLLTSDLYNYGFN